MRATLVQQIHSKNVPVIPLNNKSGQLHIRLEPRIPMSLLQLPDQLLIRDKSNPKLLPKSTVTPCLPQVNQLFSILVRVKYHHQDPSFINSVVIGIAERWSRAPHISGPVILVEKHGRFLIGFALKIEEICHVLFGRDGVRPVTTYVCFTGYWEQRIDYSIHEVHEGIYVNPVEFGGGSVALKSVVLPIIVYE